MGIYIPGVSMPKYEKALHLDIYSDGIVLMWQMGDDGKVVGTAIELPPHGRLGDLDALRAEHGLGEICENCPVDKRYCQYEMIYTKMEVCGWLDDAPTIIPADGGADG